MERGTEGAGEKEGEDNGEDDDDEEEAEAEAEEDDKEREEGIRAFATVVVVVVGRPRAPPAAVACMGGRRVCNSALVHRHGGREGDTAGQKREGAGVTERRRCMRWVRMLHIGGRRELARRACVRVEAKAKFVVEKLILDFPATNRPTLIISFLNYLYSFA